MLRLAADQLQGDQSAVQSPSQAARRLSKEPLPPVELISVDAAPLVQTTVAAAAPASAGLQEASTSVASEKQESAPLQPIESPEASGSEPESSEGSYTESESGASAASTSRALPASCQHQVRSKQIVRGLITASSDS